MRWILLLLTGLLALPCSTDAQRASRKADRADERRFGDLGRSDFKPELSPDSARAVVVFVRGSSRVESQDGRLWLRYDHHERIRILSPEGHDVARYAIPLRTAEPARERLVDLQASTFNRDRGKPVELPVVGSDVAETELGDGWTARYFRFPSVRPGSVLEVRFTIRSELWHDVRSWDFQRDIPVLDAVYTAAIPEPVRFRMLWRGDSASFIHTRSQYVEPFAFSSGSATVSAAWTVTEHRIARRDVPALRDEPFAPPVADRTLGVDFELAAILGAEGLTRRRLIGSWSDFDAARIEADGFGGYLREAATLKPVAGDAVDARSIARAMRERLAWDETWAASASAGPGRVRERGRGNSAELNLLLVAALRGAGIAADPVLVAAPQGRIPPRDPPLASRFGHVVALAVADGDSLIFDLTGTPEATPTADVLHGFGRLVRPRDAGWVRLRTRPLRIAQPTRSWKSDSILTAMDILVALPFRPSRRSDDVDLGGPVSWTWSGRIRVAKPSSTVRKRLTAEAQTREHTWHLRIEPVETGWNLSATVIVERGRWPAAEYGALREPFDELLDALQDWISGLPSP